MPLGKGTKRLPGGGGGEAQKWHLQVSLCYDDGITVRIILMMAVWEPF